MPDSLASKFAGEWRDGVKLARKKALSPLSLQRNVCVDDPKLLDPSPIFCGNY